MSDSKKVNYIITPKFRVSFPSLFIPSAMGEDQRKKYSVVMLFDRKVDLTAIKNLIRERVAEKWGTNPPKGLRLPLRDGNEKDYEGYKDVIFATASSLQRPGVVDRNRQPILNSEDVYPGCWAVASITAFAWDNKGVKGVSLGLRSLMKIADGQAFVGKSNPEEEFKSVELPAEESEEKGSDDAMFDL